MHRSVALTPSPSTYRLTDLPTFSSIQPDGLQESHFRDRVIALDVFAEPRRIDRVIEEGMWDVLLEDRLNLVEEIRPLLLIPRGASLQK
jgi:hypothetical protein